MAKRTEDHIQDEVRRRIVAYHAAAGVPRQNIALEVLFLLPPEFVRAYQELFWQAVSDPISPQGDGGKDEGRIKAKGTSRDPMRARSMGGAAPGKRYIQSNWPVRDPRAADAKSKLDRSLVRSVTRVLSELRGTQVDEQVKQRRCGECGQFLKAEWLRCPFHPTS